MATYDFIKLLAEVILQECMTCSEVGMSGYYNERRAQVEAGLKCRY